MPSHARRELRPLLVRPTVWNCSLRNDRRIKAKPWIAETSRDCEGRSLLNPGSAHPGCGGFFYQKIKIPGWSELLTVFF